MTGETGKTQPPTTALTEPYWEGCRQGELRLQQCLDCDAFQFYPRLLCCHCGHRNLAWTAASGRGRIASFTVVHRPISGAYPTPTIIVLVDLEEGPRMMSSLLPGDTDRPQVGGAVQVDFTAWSEELSMPVFRVVREESES